MPLIYSFVARDTTVLAEYTPYTGKRDMSTLWRCRQLAKCASARYPR